MRLSQATEYHEVRDALSQDWMSFFERWSLLPILVPNGTSTPNQYYQDFKIDALILTGGEDLNQVSEAAKKRKKTEECLLYEAIKRRIPVLGVCRGMHLINDYFGGRLSEMILEQGIAKHEVQHLERIGNIEPNQHFWVNSYHNYGVQLSDLSEKLQPLSLSVKGNHVESLRHESLPIIGIQWHPERENVMASLLDQALITEWLSLCA